MKEFDTFFFLKTFFATVLLHHTCKYKIKMIKTIPFASITCSLCSLPSVLTGFQVSVNTLIPKVNLSRLFLLSRDTLYSCAQSSLGHSDSHRSSPELFTALASPSPWESSRRGDLVWERVRKGVSSVH